MDGGVVIDHTQRDESPKEWIAYYEVETRGKGKSRTAIVYKAVDARLDAGHHYRLTRYDIGATVAAPDWRDSTSCGHGLHFGPTPAHARFYLGSTDAPRYLAVEVKVADIVVLGDKIKVPSCRVLHEVDEHMRPIVAAEAVSA